ncbi:LD-carboxypeptidase [Candidatus Bipolaricaulota bacterium]|nr:LD-carboxypeptidase [Candidatus Bipolaricaulota bacterium]
MRRPKKLKKGDTIKLVAPASYTNSESLKKGINYLEAKGYNIKLGYSLLHLSRHWSFSSEARKRAQEINEGFKNEEIDAMFCVKGGYGSPHLCDKLDYDLIKANPKIFLGYSDITALHFALQSQTGLVTFHGPMVATDFGKDIKNYTETMFNKAVINDEPWTITNPKEGPMVKTLNKGESVGVLLGGNLSLISNLIGTPYEPKMEDKILFIEEVNEPIYVIDRYLTHLKLSGVFKEIKGLIFGKSIDCSPKNNGNPGLEELISTFFQDYDIPVLYDLACGHGENMATLPEGVRAKINTSNKTLKILDSPVI